MAKKNHILYFKKDLMVNLLIVEKITSFPELAPRGVRWMKYCKGRVDQFCNM